MGLIGNLFGRAKPRDVRETTADELNVVFVPLRDKVCDFKERTDVSWVPIAEAIQLISVRLLVQARGLEGARLAYRFIVSKFDALGGVPVGAIAGCETTPIAPERLAELNGMLWDHANSMIARGKPVEHVAQAFGSCAMMIAEHAARGEDWLVKFLLAQSERALESDEYFDATLSA